MEKYREDYIYNWKLNDGSVRILADNFEEGINHTVNRRVEMRLNIPTQIRKDAPIKVIEIWHKQNVILSKQKPNIILEQAQTKLFNFKKR